ncbi:hemolysin family protein [Elioraea rosea]|uniref:hemolysin family protein n=1 Tax=Elioraea rosea TaxID=2492390 RepID=UPI001185AD0D|nr:hemolysin family protein [Elioraea rosea]
MSNDGSIPRLIEKLRRLVGRRNDEALRESLEELLVQRTEEAGEGEEPPPPLDPQERLLISNVLRLRGTTADDVMVPRTDIVAAPATLNLDELTRLFQREGHSRVPIFRETLDDIVGMIHIRDLFAARAGTAPFAIEDLLRKPLFVPPSKPVLDLLREMRASRMHMALVVDEYGGIDGLVTIEDIVEEIVGDIADEHDEPDAPLVMARPDGSLDIDARMPVEEFERHVGPLLTEAEHEAEIETVGGLVLSLAGRVPIRGETIAHPSGLSFRVLDADSRRIRKLRVTPPAPAPEQDAA